MLFDRLKSKITGIKRNHCNHYKKSGQSILDFVLAFIAVALLAVGIVRIWVWFNANYAGRQMAYQQSRIVAGTPKSTYDGPIDIGATPDEPEMIYNPLDLTEEWVFQGIPSGTVTGAPVGTGYTSPEVECKDQCLGQDDCGDDPEDFNINCVCYIQCICNANIEVTINTNAMQIENLRIQADTLRSNADELRDVASECDDWWETCSWGVDAGELYDAADDLDKAAADLDSSADNLEDQSDMMQQCCEEETQQAQRDCFELIEGCQILVDVYIDTWSNEVASLQTSIDNLQTIINQINISVAACNANADAICDGLCIEYCHNDVCDPMCRDGEHCGDPDICCDGLCWVQVETEPDVWVWVFDDDCFTQCYDVDCMPPCEAGCYIDNCQPHYYPCYDNERNSCCQELYCDEDDDTVNCVFDASNGWGKNCDEPNSDCDEDCAGEPDCPGCGLLTFADRLGPGISLLQDQITNLETKINDIPTCCDYDDLQDQLDCMQDIVNE